MPRLEKKCCARKSFVRFSQSFFSYKKAHAQASLTHSLSLHLLSICVYMCVFASLLSFLCVLLLVFICVRKFFFSICKIVDSGYVFNSFFAAKWNVCEKISNTHRHTERQIERDRLEHCVVCADHVCCFHHRIAHMLCVVYTKSMCDMCPRSCSFIYLIINRRKKNPFCTFRWGARECGHTSLCFTFHTIFALTIQFSHATFKATREKDPNTNKQTAVWKEISTE